MPDYLLVYLFIASVILVLIGPSLWLLVQLYRKWDDISRGGAAGRILGVIAWPGVALIGLIILAFLFSDSDPLAITTDIDEYEHTLDSWYDPTHVAHFPPTVADQQVRQFRTRRIDFPDIAHQVLLVVDVSPERAQEVYQIADREAAYVVTWRDSTSVPVVRAHRSGPPPDAAPLRFPSFVSDSTSAANYVGYFFKAQPYRYGDPEMDGENAGPAQNEVIYGIAFHKSRSRVMYWSEWGTR